MEKDSDGFTIVSRGGVLKKKGNKGTSQSLLDPSLSSEKIVLLVKQRVADLSDSSWATECLSVIDKCRARLKGRICCRGVGCVGRSEIARLQCAFALLLQQRFGEGRPDYIEPLLSEGEKTALRELGFDLERGSDSPSPCDIVYAPHAPAGLYHNELRLRWSETLLQDCLIIGNCFSNYWFRLPPGRAPLIARVEPFVREVALPNNPDASSSFNDTAVHSFSFGEQRLMEISVSEQGHNDPEML